MDVFNLISKSVKCNKTLKIISNYLLNLGDFAQMLKMSGTNENSIGELTKIIANNMELESFDNDTVLFRYGEFGNKFYFVLTGHVEILVPRIEKVMFNETEYINYLLKLRRADEIELLSLCLTANNDTFKIDKEFDVWMKVQSSALDSFENNIRKRISFKDGIIGSDGVNNGDKIFMRNLKKLIKMDTIPKSKKVLRRLSIFNNKIIYTAIKETLDYIDSNRNKTFKSNISLDDYIKITKSETIGSDPLVKDEKKLVSVYSYHHVNTFHTGDRFGDLSINSLFQKRNSTVIVRKDSKLGVIDKLIFDTYISEINEKYKKQILSFLFSYEIFKGFSKISFESHYSKYIKYKNCKYGEKIFIEKTKLEFIMFINSGEYEIDIYGSIFELKELIKQLKEKKISHHTIDYQKIKTCKTNSINSDFLDKKNIRIGIIKDKEILGLYEFLYLYNFNPNVSKSEVQNIFSFFTITCNSQYGELYYIPINLFNNIYLNEKLIRENSINYYEMRKEFYISRLENYKTTKINLYKKKLLIEDKESFSTIKKNINKSKIQLIKNQTPRVEKNFTLFHHLDYSPIINLDKLKKHNENTITKSRNRNLFYEYKDIVKDKLFKTLFENYLQTYYSSNGKEEKSIQSKKKIEKIENNFNQSTSNFNTYRTLNTEVEPISCDVRIIDPLVMDNFKSIFASASSKCKLEKKLKISIPVNKRFIIKKHSEYFTKVGNSLEKKKILKIKEI